MSLCLYYDKGTNRGKRGKMNQNTVTINGTVYDKQTGLPIRTIDAPGMSKPSHARSIHQRTQRSTTLNRAYVKPRTHPANIKPQVEAATTAAVASPAATPVKVRQEVKRSPQIQKFAPRPIKAPIKPASQLQKPAQKTVSDISPSYHPVRQKISSTAPAQKSKMPKPSQMIKAEATRAALESAPSHNRPPHRAKSLKRTKKQRFGRALSFASTGAALLLIAGYFTYVNMPNLSVRVAAVQSGVNASYPAYRPSGYSLNGRIAYDNNQVSMKFAANGTPQSFVLKQSESGWNSSAVLDNYVRPLAGDNYTTTTEGGLTVYSFNGNAAWVNNGILYTIEGDAPLSSDQIQRVASSI